MLPSQGRGRRFKSGLPLTKILLPPPIDHFVIQFGGPDKNACFRRARRSSAVRFRSPAHCKDYAVWVFCYCMRKLILETITGIILSVIGFWMGSIYFSDFQNASPLLLSVSIVLLLIGVYILFKAGRRDAHIPQFKHTPSDSLKGKSILEKNNEMINTYEKTTRMREKLRIIKRIG